MKPDVKKLISTYTAPRGCFELVAGSGATTP